MAAVREGARRADVPEDQVVCSKWPATTPAAYPAEGEEDSWRSLLEEADRAGCTVTLKGRW